MKKIVTILLLVLLGYNSIGYYFYFLLRQKLAEKEISNYINNGNFLQEELTLFKVPLAEYYQKSAKDFNRVEGDFEFEGKFYETVKERIEDDTIYIYCINDEKQQEIYKQLTEHVNENILDGKAPSGKATKIYKDLVKEYIFRKSPFIKNDLYLLCLQSFNLSRDPSYIDFHSTIPTPPPRLS